MGRTDWSTYGDQLADLVASMWLYIGHHGETQLTTEQKELLYDVLDASRPDPNDKPLCRWWRS